MREVVESVRTTKTFFNLMKGNRARIWTTLGGGVLIFVIWQLALVLVTLFVPAIHSMLLTHEAVGAREEAFGISILLLAGFGPAFIVLILWRKLMERRSARSLITSKPHIRWPLVLVGALVVGVLGLGLTFAFDPDSVAQVKERANRFTAVDWMMLSLAYGVGIGVQASFEEVYFRGWLLQHISRFMPSALGAILATSLVFSLAHIGHPGWATYVVTFVLGGAYGWSAWRLQGLEAAMGAHIGNNMVGALLTGQMITGNSPTMDLPQAGVYAVYVLGFLLFVEVWARFFEKPSRA